MHLCNTAVTVDGASFAQHYQPAACVCLCANYAVCNAIPPYTWCIEFKYMCSFECALIYNLHIVCLVFEIIAINLIRICNLHSICYSGFGCCFFYYFSLHSHIHVQMHLSALDRIYSHYCDVFNWKHLTPMITEKTIRASKIHWNLSAWFTWQLRSVHRPFTPNAFRNHWSNYCSLSFSYIPMK